MYVNITLKDLTRIWEDQLVVCGSCDFDQILPPYERNDSDPLKILEYVRANFSERDKIGIDPDASLEKMRDEEAIRLKFSADRLKSALCLSGKLWFVFERSL
jgi:hypothetical protein